MVEQSIQHSREEVLAIDPGNLKSGYVLVREAPDELGGLTILKFGVVPNEELRTLIDTSAYWTHVVLETPRPQGMPTASEVMDTLVEIGKFVERAGNRPWSFAFRGKIKVHLCGVANAKDPNVRQALIDHFGGDSTSIGSKKCPTCHGKGKRGVTKLICTVCKGACTIATSKDCTSCKGVGRKIIGRGPAGKSVDCDRCDGSGNKITEHKCSNCKGIGTKGAEPNDCEDCSGSGWEFPPGPLHGLNSHVWPALGVAIWWLATRDETQKITLVDSSKMRQERERNAPSKD